jgi:hypothetical protein
MRELGIQPGEAKAFLESHGYRVFRINGGNDAAVTEFEAMPI